MLKFHSLASTLSLSSAVLIPVFSYGMLPSSAFWRAQQALVITTAAQSVPVGTCSKVTTVRTKNGAGAFAPPSSNLTVSLATSGSLTFYSDANCTTPTTSVMIPAGNSSANFYFFKTRAVSENITLTASSYTAVTQTENGILNAYVWTGGGADANWSTAANWSGNAAPGAGNQALFNGTCASNCSPVITSNISVAGIRIESGYTGTITQKPGVTISIGSSGWYQVSGTFAGGDGNISIGGPYTLSGGTFTSTSGTLSLNPQGSFMVTNSPTFNHNNGRLVISTSQAPLISGVGNISFYNVDIEGRAPSDSLTLTGNMNVLGSLRFVDYGYLNSFKGTGTVNVSQNLELQGTRWSIKPGITIRMIGTGTITGSTGSFLGSLEINTAGTITLASTGSIDISGDFTYTSGSVVSADSTVRFTGTTQNITPGTMPFNHVAVVTQDNGTVVESINGTMTVLGDLTLNCDSYYASMNAGTINVSGNLNILGRQFNGGTTLIRMVGTGKITGSGAGSSISPLEIATSGTITFAATGSIDIQRAFTYTSGTVMASGSLIRFVGANPVTLNSGSMIFENLVFSLTSQSPNTVIGTTYVNGNLTLNGAANWPSSNGGTIEVKGNLAASGGWEGGTTSLVLTGNGIQTMTRAGWASYPGATITVNNASSILTLGSALTLSSNQGIDVIAGNVDMAGYSLTTKSLSLNSNTLTKNDGVLTVNGAVAGTGALFGGTVNP